MTTGRRQTRCMHVLLVLTMLVLAQTTPDVNGDNGEIGKICKHHEGCSGGALCRRGRCICPRGYIVTSHNSKCAKIEAVVGLGEGEPCDEINDERYCGHRLVCLKQQGSAVSTCVKNVAYVTLPNTIPVDDDKKPCAVHHDCDGGALCFHGRCRCPPGYRMTSHKTNCVKRGVIFDLPEGATCDEVHETRYCRSGLICLVQENSSENKCVKRVTPFTQATIAVDDDKKQCVEHHDCRGGALCLHGRCRCTQGYRMTSDKTKCLKRGVTFDLPEGATCDEINERRYCASGLICLSHENSAENKCVRCATSANRDTTSEPVSSSSPIRRDISYVLIALGIGLIIMIIMLGLFLMRQTLSGSPTRMLFRPSEPVVKLLY